MKTRLNNSAFISIDLAVAVVLVLVVLMLALQIIPALNPPVPETNMKQVFTATRTSDMLISDQGWRASYNDPYWEKSWNSDHDASRIGFSPKDSQQNTLDENKVSALMYEHQNDTPANWWNNSWLYRQRMRITNQNATSALYDNYSVSITVDTASLIRAGKMLANGDDLRITYRSGTSEIELDRINETDFNTPSTEIWFRTQKLIPEGASDDNYSMYYGNPKAGEPPANRSKVYSLWEPFDNTANWTNWTNRGSLPKVSGSGIINISNDPIYSNLTGWTRYKVVNITGSTASLSNYQLKIDTPYDNDMQSDFDDIRFTLSDGVTLLDHWRESYAANTSATFWVKVPNISASPNTTNILMQYGNATVSNKSNGDATFEFFDDFNGTTLNLSKWQLPYNAFALPSNSELIMIATDVWGQVWSINKYSLPLRFVSRVKRLNAEGSAHSGLEFWINNFNYDTVVNFMDPTGDTYAYIGKNGSENWSIIGNWALNTWYHFEIRANSSEVEYYRDGVLRHTEKNPIYIPTRPMEVEFELSSSLGIISADYVFVSKYASPEPTYILEDEQTNEDAGLYHSSFSFNGSEGFLIKQRSRSNSSDGDHAFAYWLANVSGTATKNISSAYFARDGVMTSLSRRIDNSVKDINFSLSPLTTGTWYTYEVLRKQDGGMRIARNGSLLIDWTYDTNLTNRSLAVGRWGNGSSEHDWLLVRKYLDPEPSTSLDLVDKLLTSAAPWWEYPVGSSSESEKENASRALGLRGYNFYMQLRPLNESLFNELRANYNITRNVPDARAAVVERFVFIRGLEALVNASGKTAGYRLVLWVW